eukprot:gene24872-biopygen11945
MQGLRRGVDGKIWFVHKCKDVLGVNGTPLFARVWENKKKRCPRGRIGSAGLLPTSANLRQIRCILRARAGCAERERRRRSGGGRVGRRTEGRQRATGKHHGQRGKTMEHTTGHNHGTPRDMAGPVVVSRGILRTGHGALHGQRFWTTGHHGERVSRKLSPVVLPRLPGPLTMAQPHRSWGRWGSSCRAARVPLGPGQYAARGAPGTRGAASTAAQPQGPPFGQIRSLR